MVQEYEGGLFAIYVLGGLNMNVKEIAQAVGKPERTVHNWVQRVSAKMAQVGAKMAQASIDKKPADYDIDETIAIIEQGMGKNAAAIFRENAGNKPKEIDRLDRLEKLVENLIILMSKTVPVRSYIPPTKQIESVSVPEMSSRNKLNQIVRFHCDNTEEPHGMAWNRLYNAIYYRLGINVNVRSKNIGISAIEYLEQEELIEKAIVIAEELYGLNNSIK